MLPRSKHEPWELNSNVYYSIFNIITPYLNCDENKTDYTMKNIKLFYNFNFLFGWYIHIWIKRISILIYNYKARHWLSRKYNITSLFNIWSQIKGAIHKLMHLRREYCKGHIVHLFCINQLIKYFISFS